MHLSVTQICAKDMLPTKKVLPTQGDIRDSALMALSIAVLIFFSMQLYRIYVHLYYAAGLRPLVEVLRGR